MSRIYKVLITIFLIVMAGLLVWAGFLVFKRANLPDIIAKNLPGVSTPGTVNLPGKLLGPQTPDHAANLDANEIIKWTNFYRAQEGLTELTINTNLTQAAQNKVKDMFQNQYFEHVSPAGVTPADIVLKAGYNYKTTGENLALGDFKDEKELVDAWYASPGHRANILNPEYTQIGVASGLDKFEDRGTTWLSVQEFGHPAPNCLKPEQDLAQQIETDKNEYDQLKIEYDALLANNKKLSKDKYDQAVALQNELNSLYNEIDALVNNYNAQVDSYNICIKQ